LIAVSTIAPAAYLYCLITGRSTPHLLTSLAVRQYIFLRTFMTSYSRKGVTYLCALHFPQRSLQAEITHISDSENHTRPHARALIIYYHYCRYYFVISGGRKVFSTPSSRLASLSYVRTVVYCFTTKTIISLCIYTRNTPMTCGAAVLVASLCKQKPTET